MGCDMLEADICMTSVGELVMIHEHELDTSKNGTGLVRDHSFEYAANDP